MKIIETGTTYKVYSEKFERFKRLHFTDVEISLKREENIHYNLIS